MDDYLSLRSLEGSRRPFGTERSPTSPERAREQRNTQSEPGSERVNRSGSKERTTNTDRGQEAARGDFSRELDELEVSKKSGVSSQHTVELATESSPTDLQPDSQPAVADTVATTVVTEVEPVLEGAPSLLPEGLPGSDSLPKLPKLPGETEVTEAPAPEPILELPPELAPPVVAAQLVARPLAPVSEGTIAEASEVALASVELGETLEANSGSLDADSGGLGNRASEANAAVQVKTESQAAAFDQALTETEAKTAARPQHSVATAESVLRQFKLEVHSQLDHAMIHLNPAELGRISIKIEMERGKLRAVMRADKAETLDLLEKHVPELRASLEASGIAADGFEFGLGLEQDAQQTDQSSTPNAWKNQTEPILEELEKRSLLAKAIVNEKRVDTYA